LGHKIYLHEKYSSSDVPYFLVVRFWFLGGKTGDKQDARSRLWKYI